VRLYARILSKEEEFEARQRLPDPAAGRALVESCLRFVLKRARYYHTRHLDVGDLLGVGVLGLYKALRTFDKNAGVKFLTYAQIVVHHSTISAINRQEPLVPDKRSYKRGGVKHPALCPINEVVLREHCPDYLYRCSLDTPVNTLLQQQVRAKVRAAVDELPPRTATIMRLRYLDDNLTFRQLGWLLGISKQRVEQIEKDALALLRYEPELRELAA